MFRRLLFLLPLFLVLPAFAATPEVKDGFFKTSDGVKLHYLEAGSGPAIFSSQAGASPRGSGIRRFGILPDPIE